MAQTIHSQYLPANRFVCGMINHAVDAGLLADADVSSNQGSAGGVAGLKTIVGNKTPQEQYRFLIPAVQNALQAGKDIGSYTDANINNGGTTTVAAVIAFLTTQDANLPANYRLSFAFPQ